MLNKDKMPEQKSNSITNADVTSVSPACTKPPVGGSFYLKSPNISPVNFAPFFESKNCFEFIRWDCGFGVCESCKLVGQSEQVNDYPINCLHLKAIQEYDNKTRS